MNLDASRPSVVLDGEVVIEKSTRSTFRIWSPLCGWSSRKGDFWSYCCGGRWPFLISDFGHKVCKKTGPALRALHQTQIRMYGKLSAP